MAEHNDKEEGGHDDESQKSVARRLVDSDAPGSEFETREMPAIEGDEEPAPEGDDDSGDEPAENYVVDSKRPGSNIDTSLIEKSAGDTADEDDEFESGVRSVADPDRPGSSEETVFQPADDEDEDAGEAPTRSATTPADPYDDLETREVPALKDEWRERAAEVAQELGEGAEVVSDWGDEAGDASLAASVAAASGEVPLPRDDEPSEIAGPVIEKACEAQEDWRGLRFEQRAGKFDNLREEMIAQRNDYVPSMATAIGRPMVETLTGEYQPVLEALRTLDEVVPPLLVEQYGASVPLTHGGIDASMAMRPYGIVLIANAARSPFAFPMTLAIDALAAGNAVLICGSETHPRINEMMRKLFQRGRFPEGLVQMLGGDSETLLAMVDARPDKVIYEGDSEIASRVAARCALRGCEFQVVRASKDTMMVLDGANLERAIQAALHGAFSGGGMVAGTLERIVVAHGLYDEFRMKFIEAAREMNSHHAQLAHIKEAFNPRRAKLLVEDAVALGARVTYPAGEAPGRWIHWKACVVEALAPKAKLSTEPFDGPGVALYRAEDPVKEVRKLLRIAPANNLSVLGPVSREQMAVLESFPVARLAVGETVAGSGGVAGGTPLGPDIPRTGAGPQAMMRPRVTLRSETTHQRLSWYPYTDDKAYAMMDAMEAMYGVEAGKRIRAALKLMLNTSKRRLLKGED